MLSTVLLVIILVFVALVALTFFLHIVVLRVPFIRTPRKAVDVMVRLARLRPEMTVFDLGAGDGSILIAAKRACPEIHAVGYEIVPTVWLLGKIRILLSGQAIVWRMRNALSADCSSASVIFLYVTPRLMRVFEEKFSRELKTGTRVISNTFRFPNRVPSETVMVKTWIGEKKAYRYMW